MTVGWGVDAPVSLDSLYIVTRRNPRHTVASCSRLCYVSKVLTRRQVLSSQMLFNFYLVVFTVSLHFSYCITINILLLLKIAFNLCIMLNFKNEQKRCIVWCHKQTFQKFASRHDDMRCSIVIDLIIITLRRVGGILRTN